MGRKETGMPTKTDDMSKPQAVFTGGASSDHGDVTLIGIVEFRLRRDQARRAKGLSVLVETAIEGLLFS